MIKDRINKEIVMAWVVSEELLKDFQNDPEGTFQRACAVLSDLLPANPKQWDDQTHEEILEVAALLEAIIDNGVFRAKVPLRPAVELNNAEPIDLVRFINQANQNLKDNQTARKFKSLKSSFTEKLGKGFYYEFSEGDLTRIQTLINELRVQISDAKDFDPEHQQRLLKRLEAVQREIHKKVSDMDRLWGLVGDAGVAIGKLGENAKPIVDRIKEITEIAWRTQARAEELPSGSEFPLLGSDTEGEDKSE